jgi:ribosomal protein S18 acetylase RimI-like enzyme
MLAAGYQDEQARKDWVRGLAWNVATDPTNRASLDTLRADVEQGISDLSSTDRSALSEQLSAVGVLLTAQPRLRRALADPSMSPEARSTLATTLLQNKIGSSAMAVVRTAVQQRWSSPWDLVDSIEQTADDVLLYDAEVAGSLGEIEPLGTHPAFRGHGLGRTVLLEVTRRLHRDGIKRVSAKTWDDNLGAVRSYQSAGYAEAVRMPTFAREFSDPGSSRDA